MNQTLAKNLAKISVATAAMIGMGAMYRAEKQIDEKIDEHYDKKKDAETQS